MWLKLCMPAVFSLLITEHFTFYMKYFHVLLDTSFIIVSVKVIDLLKYNHVITWCFWQSVKFAS
jgi:hypothetical protein